MAWTTPKTWSVGEGLSAALFNAHIRDNLNYLYGFRDGTTVMPTPKANDLYLDNTAGTNRHVFFTTDGSLRWAFLTNSVAESGADAGSDFSIGRYSDAGAFLGFPIYISRSNGTVSIAAFLNVANGKLFTDGSNTIIGGFSAGTSAVNTLVINNGTAPTSNPAGTAQLYVLSGELWVEDASGNATQLSSHSSQMVDTSGRVTQWVYKDRNAFTGTENEIDVVGAVQWVEQESGETFIHSRSLPPSQRRNPYRSLVKNKRQAIRQRMQPHE